MVVVVGKTTNPRTPCNARTGRGCMRYTVEVFFLFFFSHFQILLEIRVKKARAPYTFVCVPVFVHLQNADFVSTSPLRFSQHYGLAGLLRLNPIRFSQEGQIATQESTALSALSLTWIVRYFVIFFLLSVYRNVQAIEEGGG